MISRRISRNPENDNYRRLANYIAGIGPHPDEDKVLFCWSAGCWAGDDYDMGITEVKATQDLNRRSQKEKTYHLIVSFRPDDEANLTREVFKEIEETFAKSLGFSEHQRHCGVHQNTGNVHMHIAYNMIHPEKLTRHEPYRDFHTRDRICRELEQRFGLAVDNGRGQSQLPEEERLGEKATTMEAHSGQESFETYARTRREATLESLQGARSWQDAHKAMAGLGLAIAPHGNGLVIKDRHGKQACKASAVDRGLSKSKLEKRLGPFQPPGSEVAAIPSLESYQPRPSPRHQDPSNGELFKAWSEAMEGRRAELAKLRDATKAEISDKAEFWRKTRLEIERMAIGKRDRAALLHHARQNEREVRRSIFKRASETRDTFCKEKPFMTWACFREIAQERYPRQAKEQDNSVER